VTTVERWTGHEARLLRHALRLSVRGFAEHLGLPARTISKWEAAGARRTPRPEQQQLLDLVLQRADDGQRARFEAALGVHLPVEVFVSSGQQLDLVAVAGLRERVRSLVSSYDVTPSVALVAPATQLQARVMDWRGVAVGRVRRELFGVEAEVSILLGQLVWDASQRRDHTTPAQHFAHAAVVAREVEDAVTEAYAILRQAFLALYGKPDPVGGRALAARAATLSRRRSPVLAGLALLHVAEAEAMLGDRRACERALHHAELALAARTDLDPAADQYSPAQAGRLSGSCYLSLRLPERAVAHLADTAQLMGNERKVSALVMGNLALAHIACRDLEAATAWLHDAIDELERTRGGGGLNVVFKAGRQLHPWRAEPLVYEVQDRLLGLMATA
jgi:transcriptional regulator with XRE-family HTH domain